MRLLLFALFAVSFACQSAAASPDVKLPVAGLDRILFAQIGNTRIKDPAVLAGQRAFIWGATPSAISSGVYTSYYYPSNRDFDRTRDFAWYRKNKPEWVAYQCDRSTPAYDHSYAWGAYVPLDITRADVRAYIRDAFLAPAIARGFSAIAYDNVGITNSVHRCGVWRGGQWVQQYNGETREPAYAAAVIDYISWVRREVNGLGAALALNAHVNVRQIETSFDLLSLADIWLDEGGFSNDCRRRVVDDIWRGKFNLVARKASKSPYVSMNTTCEKYSNVPADERSWIVANFLLARGPQSYLTILGMGEGGRLLDYQGLDPDIGRPAGEPHAEGDLYRRDYERGLVLVNPASKSPVTFYPAALNLLLDGRAAPPVVTLPPRSGIILTKEFYPPSRRP